MVEQTESRKRFVIVAELLEALELTVVPDDNRLYKDFRGAHAALWKLWQDAEQMENELAT